MKEGEKLANESVEEWIKKQTDVYPEKFSWGEVKLYQDPKAGFSNWIVSYNKFKPHPF